MLKLRLPFNIIKSYTIFAHLFTIWMRLDNTITVDYIEFSGIANRLAGKDLPCEFFCFLLRNVLMVNPNYYIEIFFYDELEMLGHR